MYEMVYENNSGEWEVMQRYDSMENAQSDLNEACFGLKSGKGSCEKICKAVMSGRLKIRKVA